MVAFGESARREELGRALSRLRVTSGLSQPQLAEKLGLSQPKVSRIEAGKQRIRVPEVDAWCRATSTTDDRRQHLLGLAEDALVGPMAWDEAGEEVELQRSTAEMEAKAGLISVYQPAVLPGLVQTATYARRVFSAGPEGEPSNLAAKVLGRLERQRVLYDDAKQFRFVVPETVLRWPFGPAGEQIEQLERLREIIGRPNVDLRIAPMVGMPVWRTGGFVLFDKIGDLDPRVHLELLTRPINIEEPDQVAFYRRAFAKLLDASLAADGARDLLERVIEDFRGAD